MNIFRFRYTAASESPIVHAIGGQLHNTKPIFLTEQTTIDSILNLLFVFKILFLSYRWIPLQFYSFHFC
jgi:hypothetical protein